MSTKAKTLAKRGAYLLLALSVGVNVIAAFHAWKFTHFEPGAALDIKDESNLSFSEKLKALLTGVSLPRPENKLLPEVPYNKISIQSNRKLGCWYIPTDVEAPKGTVVLLHGYGGSKAAMLDRAMFVRCLGYHTLLPDFMGAGDSEGNECTIGFEEARQVTDCVRYLKEQGEENIVLLGTSMGAAAAMKAVADDSLDVSGLIAECPYASMLRTVENRFQTMGVPPVVLPRLLVFWGGLENGFNAFSLEPEQYASAIRCPTLLIWGQNDNKVLHDEIERIHDRLACPKSLLTLPNSGHNDFLAADPETWKRGVTAFLASATGSGQNSL